MRSTLSNFYFPANNTGHHQQESVISNAANSTDLLAAGKELLEHFYSHVSPEGFECPAKGINYILCWCLVVTLVTLCFVRIEVTRYCE